MTTPQEARELAEHYADTTLVKPALRSLASQVEALTAALAKSQPVEQGEPVGHWTGFMVQWTGKEPPMNTPLFTHPVRPMSDEQIDQIWMLNGGGLAANRYHDFARAIEAHIKGATE